MPYRNDDRTRLWEGAPGRADPNRRPGPGPYGRPWGSPDYGEPLTQAQMDREADERAIRARNREAGQGDPAFDYERPDPNVGQIGGRGTPVPWLPEIVDTRETGTPRGSAERQYQQYDRERQLAASRPQGVGGILASGRQARAIAREAFAGRQGTQRPQSAPSRQPVRRGGRRGRPASHPGARRGGGFRLGDLLGGLSSRGGMVRRAPQAIVGGMAGVAPSQAFGGMAGVDPRAALGGWMGGRRS